MRASTAQFPSIAYVLSKHDARSLQNSGNGDALRPSLDLMTVDERDSVTNDEYVCDCGHVNCANRAPVRIRNDTDARIKRQRRYLPRDPSFITRVIARFAQDIKRK